MTSKVTTRLADRVGVRTHSDGRAKIVFIHNWFGVHVLLNRDQASEFCATIMSVFPEATND